MLKLLFIFTTLFSISTTNISYASSELNKYLRNYTRISENIATSGLIRNGGITALVNNSFSVVIDVRTPPEGIRIEEEKITKAGMKYYNVPVSGRSIHPKTVAQFSKIMHQHKNDKVLVHCVSANRVGGLWTLYQIQNNRPKEAAFEQGKAIGMSRYLEKIITNQLAN